MGPPRFFTKVTVCASNIGCTRTERLTMSTFAAPIDDSGDEELAANMDTFVGTNVAVQAISLNVVPISTSFGTSPALRVKVINLDSGELTTPHLLFWTKVQEQVIASQESGVDWVVGTLVSIPQKADPTRSVYLIRGNPELDLEAVGLTIHTAEARRVHPTASSDDNVPFGT